MKECGVNFNMCADIENTVFLDNLLGTFESYIEKLVNNIIKNFLEYDSLIN